MDPLLLEILRGWGLNVFGGHLLAFVGKRRDRLKILGWHRGGFALIYKRLEKGRFRIPSVKPVPIGRSDPTDLTMLLDDIELSGVRRPALCVGASASALSQGSKKI